MSSLVILAIVHRILRYCAKKTGRQTEVKKRSPRLPPEWVTGKIKSDEHEKFCNKGPSVFSFSLFFASAPCAKL